MSEAASGADGRDPVRRVLIMGAGGRDFHDFNLVHRDDPAVEVVAFTATQIPGIDDRTYPPALAGPRYPDGIPIHPEAELVALIERERVDEVVFAYSDVAYEHVMHRAAAALAAGADFTLLGPRSTMIAASRAGRRGLRGAHGERQEPDQPGAGPGAARRRPAGGADPPPDALRRPRADARAAVRDARRDRRLRPDDRGARGVRAPGRRGDRRLRGRGLRGDRRGRRGRGRRDRSGTAATTTSRSSSPTC